MLEAARTIWKQMGGNQIIALVGAHKVVGSDEDNYLMFAFKGCRKANKVRVTLTPADLYKMEFFKITNKRLMDGTAAEPVEVYEDIYNDQLKELFEEFTGLWLTWR